MTNQSDFSTFNRNIFLIKILLIIKDSSYKTLKLHGQISNELCTKPLKGKGVQF